MPDPCEPSTLHIHRHHAPHAIGRIRRHGTAHVARQLHRGTGACLAGKISNLTGTLLKAGVPAAGVLLLHPAGSTITVQPAAVMPAPITAPSWFFPAPAGSFTILPGSGHHGRNPVTPPGGLTHPIPLPEPSSLALLGVAAFLFCLARRVAARIQPRRLASILSQMRAARLTPSKRAIS